MMSDKVFFSIIIPTYNRASFISKTILQFVNQPFSSFEIIIVDDGSTDNTSEEVLAINDSRISYYKIENSERGFARNFGCKKTSGLYVTFFDSDDEAYNNHLQTVHDVIVANNFPQWVHSSYHIKLDSGIVINSISNLDGDVNSMLVKHGNLFSCSGVFVKHDIAIEHPFINDRSLAGSEDAVLWTQLAARFPVVTSNKITWALIQHDSRSVININKEKLIKRIELYIHHCLDDGMILKTFPFAKKYIPCEGYSYLALHFALDKNNKMTSIQFLMKAIIARPGFVFSKRMLVTIRHLLF